MKEIAEKLIEKYDGIISVLEVADNGHKSFLENAYQQKNVPFTDVKERMKQAKENHQRLQTAIAEREPKK